MHFNTFIKYISRGKGFVPLSSLKFTKFKLVSVTPVASSSLWQRNQRITFAHGDQVIQIGCAGVWQRGVWQRIVALFI